MARQDGGREPSDDEVDRAFADLMASFEGSPTRWPGETVKRSGDPEGGAADDSGQLDSGPFDRGTPGADSLPAPVPEGERPTPPDSGTVGGPRDYVAPDEPDEGFVPPEPAPLGGGEPLTTLAWSLAVGGPVLTVLALVLWPSAPRLVWIAPLVAALAGAAVLVWRMPRRRDPDDHDDGAVV